MTGSATFLQPDHTSQNETVYKTAIDAAIMVMARTAAAFAVHEQDQGSPSPEMSVRVDAGAIQNGTALTAVAAQTVDGFVAPSANPRNDLIVLNARTGTATRVAGSESGTLADPTPTAGTIVLARVRLTVGMTEIVDADIDPLMPTPLPLNIGALTAVEADSAADYIVLLDATDGQLKKALFPPNKDQTARDLAMVGVIGAYSSGGLRGPVAAFIPDSDHFATKTNATFDTDHYDNSSTSTESTTPDTTSDAYGTNTYFFVDRNFAVDNSSVVTHLGWRSNVAKTVTLKLVQRTGAGAYTVVASATLNHSGGDAFEYAALASPYAVAGSGDFYVGMYISTGGSTYSMLNSGTRAFLSGASDTSSYAGATEDTSLCFPMAVRYQGAATDMTLADDAVTLETPDPDTVDVYVLEKEDGSPAPTRRIRASLDGGSNWSDPGTLEDSFSYGDKRLYRYSCDMSGLVGGSPDGDRLTVEYNTLDDGVEREFHGLWAVPLYA